MLSRRRWFALGTCLCVALAGCGSESDGPQGNGKSEKKTAGKVDRKSVARGSSEPKQRSFLFDYGAKLTKLTPGAKVRVWMPVPPSNEYQKVKQGEQHLPAEGKVAEEPKYGNRILYFETAAPESGELEFSTAWEVQRSEVLGRKKPDDTPAPLSAEQRKVFLAANTKVPVGDKKPLALLKGLDLPEEGLKLGETLYGVVELHMTYDKSQPGYGSGDALWACDSKFGNCTDFHSLFISLARSQGLPGRFEIGFPLPPDETEGEVGGYHCWAFFYADGHGWVPVDISEADKHPDMKDYYFGNLTADRVSFTVGRDLDLVPKQDGEPLNFFVYPYVEVDGKPHTEMEKRFKFKNLE